MYENGHDGGPQPTPPEPLQALDFITLQDKPVPELRWLVRDWLPWRRVTGLFGAGGEGKTLIAQQLMTAAAIKKHWLGRNVFPVKSIGIFCEDDEEDLHRRQAEINKLYECEFTDLENMKGFARLGCNNLLLTFTGGIPQITQFAFQLLDEARAFGAQLIFIDTIADTFGGNHNDPGQVRQFVQIVLGHLARELDAVVIASGHPSRSGQLSGSGEFGSVQWDAAFRSRAYLNTPVDGSKKIIDPYVRELARRKSNYALREDKIPLRWKEGAFVNTDQPGILGTIERRRCRRVFTDLLTEMSATARPVSHNRRAGNYAPRIFGRHPRHEGYSMPDFERAMEELFANREIAVVEYRNSQRRFSDKITFINGRAGDDDISA